MIVLRLYLSALLTFPSVFKYLDKQCKHSGGMSQCQINITRNKFIAKTSGSCDGPAVRIKGDKARGRI